MPILPPAAVAQGRALFGAVGSGLFPHRAQIQRQGTTGNPAPNAATGGVARVDPVIIAADVPCRLVVVTLPTRAGAAAGASADAPPFRLAFPVGDDADALDIQSGDVVTVTGDETYPGATFSRRVIVVTVPPTLPTDMERRVTASIAPPGSIRAPGSP